MLPLYTEITTGRSVKAFWKLESCELNLIPGDQLSLF